MRQSAQPDQECGFGGLEPHAEQPREEPEPRAGRDGIEGIAIRETHHRQGQTCLPPWSDLLDRVLTNQILPRVIASHNPESLAIDPGIAEPSEREVEQFLAFILSDDLGHAHVLIGRINARGGDRDTILHGLLTPAARRLGVLWEEDRCDFAAVTLGMVRLNQIMVETREEPVEPAGSRGEGRYALFASAPGEQHGFGVAIIGDEFRRAGWQVQVEPRTSRPALLGIARRNWFDVIGISVGAERWMKGLPALIRSVRQSAMNPDVNVMVGGKAFIDHPERYQFVGADSTSASAQDALREANRQFQRRDSRHRRRALID